ncbi:pyrroloquinoline quinone biosynthesis peptide chaperone PqqD [Spirillospora sp. CA-294931]|uniref:pyrroloquinoline quinone biosynthesis peptide chaperone PqqD n=1 Tax=Spirillospora sp. CA-294931 TaxID=3240042 RepID=UPI003D8C5859
MTAPWRPALAPSVRLRHDAVRDADLLVMPERVVVLSPTAATILGACDGERTVTDIIDRLGRDFPDAPLARDVPEFLGQVRREGWVR